MRLAIALAASLIAFPAAASGGLGCKADDGRVKIDIGSAIARGMGGSLFQFQATVEIDDEALPEDLRRVTFERAAQYWLDGVSLNLLVYRERTDDDREYGYMKASVMTAFDDEGSTKGEFTITVYAGEIIKSGEEPLRYTGGISCIVD